jgi:N6-L-threonylcarbamoyladenine synthase
MILGIECTAHTFGAGIVSKVKILANVRNMYKPEKGGIIPLESRKHHARVAEKVWERALNEVGIKEGEIKAIAIANAPGLAPCLLEGFEVCEGENQIPKWQLLITY